jgi:hypothetical protein
MLSLCPLRALLVTAAQHPDAAAWTLCALMSSSQLVFAQFNLFCDLPFSFFPFPVLVYCVCRHVLIATRRSTSSCSTSPRILRIGSGGAGNRCRLRLALRWVWSLLELADLFYISCNFYYICPFFILYSLPVLSFLFHSLPLPLHNPSTLPWTR